MRPTPNTKKDPEYIRSVFITALSLLIELEAAVSLHFFFRVPYFISGIIGLVLGVGSFFIGSFLRFYFITSKTPPEEYNV